MAARGLRGLVTADRGARNLAVRFTAYAGDRMRRVGHVSVECGMDFAKLGKFGRVTVSRAVGAKL